MTAAWRNSFTKLMTACTFLNAEELDTLLAFVLEKKAADDRRQAAVLPPVMIAEPDELQ